MTDTLRLDDHRPPPAVADDSGLSRCFTMIYGLFFIMPIPEELSCEAVDTLWVLWKEREGKKFADEGLTVEQIATATNRPPQRIYNAIEELSTRGDKWNTHHAAEKQAREGQVLQAVHR